MVGVGDLVGVDIAPVSKKMAFKSIFTKLSSYPKEFGHNYSWCLSNLEQFWSDYSNESGQERGL